ncbi:MAG: GAF domain-containing protein [Bdellovibrionaceae bacterium]|nr:GAF domain-containing protein [Bdellovibrio sp.]
MLSRSASDEYSFEEILQELKGLMTGRWLTDLANTAAFLNSRFKDINWIGFYLVDVNDSEPTLWLGPFQGLPACTMISFSKGVCGAAATQKKTVRVADVDQFPGHIVCDAKSRSEVAVPMIIDDKIIGVLDVDSEIPDRFSESDQAFFEEAIEILLAR